MRRMPRHTPSLTRPSFSDGKSDCRGIGDGKVLVACADPGRLRLPDASIIRGLSGSIADMRPLPTAFLTVKRIPSSRRSNPIRCINRSLMIEWE